MKRREVLRLAAAGLGGSLAAAPQSFPTKPAGAAFRGLKVGLASYSTRELTLAQTLKALQGMSIGYIALKDFHLPMSATPQECAAVRKKIEGAGLQVLGCGVISLRNDAAQIRRALEYARDLGAPTAVVAPEPEALPALNKVVKDFDLKVAIHNHGPEDKRFPSAFGVFKAVQDLDARIGCCVDVGHTFRLAEDPAAAIRHCAPRLYDLHIKDLAGTDLRPSNVPVGTGVLDVLGILRALVQIRYAHHVALEYEAEAENPIPGMAQSFGFLRGALAAL